MAMIDTSIYRPRSGGLQALGGIGQNLASMGKMMQQSKMSDLAMQQRQFDLEQKRLQAEREEEERKRQLAQRDEFMSNVQTMQMEGEEQLTPEQMQSAYAQAYPQEYAEMQAKSSLSRMGKSSSPWVTSSQRPGWSFNKATGEWKKSEEVAQDLDPYKQGILDDKEARREEAKLRRLQAKEQHDEQFLLSRMKYETQLEEIKNTRGDKVFNQANKLADQHYNKSKEFIKQRDAYDRVQASAEDPSAAGDLALIFNYMKVLDPGSTVREGEFATAQNSGSVDERTRAWYNKIKSGQRLSEPQRLDFVNRTEKLYGKAKSNQDKLDRTYTNKSKLFKLDPNLVLYDYRSANTSGGLTSDDEALINE